MKTKQIKLSEIILSEVLQEIRPLNAHASSRYAQAMREGCVFPKITITPDNTLVMGYTRHDAMMHEYGPDHEVTAIVKEYETEADMIEDAVRDNVAHGMPMDGITRRRAMFKLRSLGRDSRELASLFNVSVKRVEEICDFNFVVVGRQPKPIKGGLSHISGKRMPAAVYKEHIKKDKGISAYSQADQLVRWIENDLIDRTCAKTVASLEQLHASLTVFLGIK